MRKMTRRVLCVVGGFAGFGVLALALLQAAGIPILGIVAHVAHVECTAYRLQHRTDHGQLLAECRQLLQDRDKYAQHGRRPESSDIHLHSVGKNAEMPPLLRSLDPPTVVIEENSVLLIFSGGHIHLGVRAYAEGQKGYDLELIPGLYMIRD
ncbi:MAG: hypothetical protein ABIF82_08965 [Planctomycetota bacterium]